MNTYSRIRMSGSNDDQVRGWILAQGQVSIKDTFRITWEEICRLRIKVAGKLSVPADELEIRYATITVGRTATVKHG